MATKRTANAPCASPSPTPGRGPRIQSGMPCQLAGIRPDGAAAASRQISTPAATMPASASDAAPRRSVRGRGRAMRRTEAGAAIRPGIYPGPLNALSDEVLLAQPGLGAPEAPAHVHHRLVAE